MARPGLEPRTPRFSGTGSERAEGSGLQALHTTRVWVGCRWFPAVSRRFRPRAGRSWPKPRRADPRGSPAGRSVHRRPVEDHRPHGPDYAWCDEHDRRSRAPFLRGLPRSGAVRAFSRCAVDITVECHLGVILHRRWPRTGPSPDVGVQILGCERRLVDDAKTTRSMRERLGRDPPMSSAGCAVYQDVRHRATDWRPP
jgi:hypothetical protein